MATTFVRRVAVPSTLLPGSLPVHAVDPEINCELVAKQCVASLAACDQDLFASDGFWRDIVCLTGTFRTFHTSSTIGSAWAELLALRQATAFQLAPKTSQIFAADKDHGWISASFTFETKQQPACKCSGILGIVPGQDGTWRIWRLSTMVESLSDSTGPDEAPGPPLEPQGHVDCLVVGASTTGMCVAGRLQSLGLRYVVAEKDSSIGHLWRNRYDSVKLHLSRHYSELPYGGVFADRSYYLTGADLAEGYQAFADKFKLNIWTSTAVEVATWDATTHEWEMTLSQPSGTRRLRAKHLVMAAGAGNDIPHTPDLTSRDSFHGDVIHASAWRNGHAWKGKRGVVVGSANTGFDMATDMVSAGLASVTMVQRSKTDVVPSRWFAALTDPLYNDSFPIDLADRIGQSGPYAIGRQMIMATARKMLADDSQVGRDEAAHYAALRDTGFDFDLAPDMLRCVMDRFGGHYLDVGGTKLIVDGEVEVKSGKAPVAFTSKGLRLAGDPGEEVEADVIVFATGFRCDARGSAAKIVGAEVADVIEDYWGLDAEGEVRGQAKPIGHPGLWFLGGGQSPARFLSRFLAIQIQADVRGMPFVPYEKHRLDASASAARA